MALNISKCRLCLKLGNFLSIFTKDNDLQFADMVMECTHIKIHVNDGLPDRICFECIEKLSCAYIFKKMCKRSDRELRNHLRLRQVLKPSSPEDQAIAPKTQMSSNQKLSSNDDNTTSQSKSYNMDIEHFLNTDIIMKSYTQEPSEKRTRTNIDTTKITSLNEEDTNISRNVDAVHKPIIINNNYKTSGDQPSKLKCDKCDKIFKLNVMLKRHLRSCNGVTPKVREIESSEPIQYWSCDICDIKFATMMYLHRHITLFHLAQNDYTLENLSASKRNVTCMFCDIQFKDCLQYSLHFNVCPRRPDPHTFMCPLCNNQINGRNIYITHVKTFHFMVDGHTTICNLCNQNKNTLESLKWHLEGHKLGTVGFINV